MESVFSLKNFEKFAPICFVLNEAGYFEFLSQELRKILALEDLSLEAPSCKYVLNDFFSLKNNPNFELNSEFFIYNQTKELIFVTKTTTTKEFCIDYVYIEQEKKFLFIARNLYPEVKKKEIEISELKSLVALVEDNPNPVVKIDFFGQVRYQNQASLDKLPQIEVLILQNEKLNHLLKKIVTEKKATSEEVQIESIIYLVKSFVMGNGKFISLYFEDITNEKKNLELVQIEKTQKVMASKLTMLGEMASGVAHEINNPLTIVMGRLDLLKKNIKNQDMNTERAKIEKNVETVDAAVKRIAYIVRGLRNFSRDGEKDPFHRVVLKQIIDDVCVLSQEKLKKNGIEFIIEGDQSIELDCRSVQIEQVLINLMNNAIDAIENLEEKWIKMSFHENQSTLNILFMDSGKGISSKDAEKIMQPFFTTKDVGKGTGLGLSISLGLVEGHNGKLSYMKEFKNTCFLIELPRFQNKLNQAS